MRKKSEKEKPQLINEIEERQNKKFIKMNDFE